MGNLNFQQPLLQSSLSFFRFLVIDVIDDTVLMIDISFSHADSELQKKILLLKTLVLLNIFLETIIRF